MLRDIVEDEARLGRLLPGSTLRICSALGAVGALLHDHTVLDEDMEGQASEALNAIPRSQFCRSHGVSLQMF